MNKKLFLAVADKLDSLSGTRARLYDQTAIFSELRPCGTVHCIGGWAIEVEAERQRKSYRNFLGDRSPSIVAAELMGLSGISRADGRRLFLANFMAGATPQQVAQRLREFVKAGRIRFRKSDFPLETGDA